MQACGPVVRPHEILQTLIISIPQPSAAVKSFFELSRNFVSPPEAIVAVSHGRGDAAARRRGVGAHRQGQKGTGHHMVSCPLLTPLTFLWTRLPSVARLKARGPQMRLVLQGFILDRSGAFRSGTLPPCTVWPRTVMRGGLRKGNSGHNSVPKAARRTEPSPRNPRLAARPQGVAARGRSKGCQEGT